MVTNWRLVAGCQSRNRPTGHSLNEIFVVARPCVHSAVFARSIVSTRDCPPASVNRRNVPIENPPERSWNSADDSTGWTPAPVGVVCSPRRVLREPARPRRETMATTELSLDSLKRHIGSRLLATDMVTASPANLLRLTLGRAEPELSTGDPLPPGWQVLYFLPRLRQDELRPDGTPIDSGIVPPMPLPRRMFAGERVQFHRPLRIGDELRREAELAELTLKSG